MRTAIRYWGVLGTVGLTELTAHFLSLGWGLVTLLAAFAWVALAGASTAAKARSTEDRLAAVIPVVGTAYATANTAQSTANTASSLAGNALPKSGGTLSGSLTVNGNHQVNGNHTVTGNISGGTDISASNNLNAGNGVNGNAVVVTSAYVNGNQLHMVQGAGGWPVASGTAWGNPMITALNNLYNALHNSNVIS
jgi:hypothetical protein